MLDDKFIEKMEELKGLSAAIHSAAVHNVPDMLRKYAEEGVNLDEPDENNGTFLMAASQAANPESVQVFLQYGANVNQINNDGMSPLIYSVANLGREVDVYKTVKLLLDAGADKTQRDIDGKTAYDWASDGRYSAKIYDLLKIDETEGGEE